LGKENLNFTEKINNSTNINKTDNHMSPRTTEHTQKHYI
jgi:hypothetical protein